MKKTIKTTRWNAELDTDVCDRYNNADLTLTLNLGFRQINPPGGAASSMYNDYGIPTKPQRKIIRWTAGAWGTWTSNMIQSAQKFWNGKFWLVNNFPILHYADGSHTYQPNIYCRIRIKHTDVALAHHSIDVVRLHSSENWFGSHSTLYDSRDTRRAKKNTDSKGKSVVQRAHVHEVGHLLGLGHVDEGKAHCPTTGNTNASDCYGVADEDMHTVMGSGMALTIFFAIPWQRAIIRLTGKGAPLTSDWGAKMRRHYPRTLDEVKRFAAITTQIPRK